MCYRNGYGIYACGIGSRKNGELNCIGHGDGCRKHGEKCSDCKDCRNRIRLPESEEERAKILFGMEEKDLLNAIRVLDTLAEFLGITDEYEHEEEDEELELIPPLMIAVRTGEPMQVITEDEAEEFLPCFGEDDLIREAPDVDLVMSCHKDLIFTVGDMRYLDGPALIYEVDDEGEIIPLTIGDIYRVKRMLEERTLLVTEEGEAMPVIALD